MRQETVAGLGKLHAAGAADEQRLAEAVLQPLDALREGLLSEEQPGGGAAEVQLLGGDTGQISPLPMLPTPGFEVHPAWKMAADRGVSGEEGESVMGVAKKAKREAKAAKRKTRKDAGKVKHKGKKVKNAAKH